MPRKTRIALRGPNGPLSGFNEAAARCRGKRGGLVGRADEALASMRPRPDAAENLRAPPPPPLHGRAPLQ